MIDDSPKSQVSLLKNGRPTVALLLGSLSSSYQEGIMWGAQEIAKELDYNVITFCGGPINNPSQFAQTRETLFDLVSKDYIDGIVMTESSHTRFLSESETKDYLRKFDSIPFVSIGSTVQGHSSVVTDFQQGISQVIDHFVTHHGYQKIAIIRGPENHSSSSVRTNIYRECLIKHGIEVDESRIVISDLTRSAAGSAIGELFDEREKECDAILCMNDAMAVGAIQALNDRGLSVPEQVAICGNMDSSLSLFSSPPLTSIMESPTDLGKEALRAIHNELTGNDNERVIRVPTTLTIRESCG